MNELSDSIDHLYSVFAGYKELQLQPAELSCRADLPHVESMRQQLLQIPLRELTASDLLDYYYLAIDHLGNSDDFRHFLPKLLDLMVHGDANLLAPAYLPIILNKAAIGQWPSIEREAVARFLRAATSGFKPSTSR